MFWDFVTGSNSNEGIFQQTVGTTRKRYKVCQGNTFLFFLGGIFDE